MKLIKHISIIEIEAGDFLIINLLNGLVDTADINVRETLRKWQDIPCVQPVNEYEFDLYEKLLSRGYFVKNDKEEAKTKAALIHKLRAAHEKHSDPIGSAVFVLTYDSTLNAHTVLKTEREAADGAVVLLCPQSR